MIQHCPSGAGLLRPRIFLFLPLEVLYMIKNYRLIAIRRFCSRIACGELSYLHAQTFCIHRK